MLTTAYFPNWIRYLYTSFWFFPKRTALWWFLTILSFVCLVPLASSFSSSPYARPHTKLSTRRVLRVFLGYGNQQKRYRCYNPVTRKLNVSRHVTFLERLPFFSLPSKHVPVSKEDLVHNDTFPLEVPVEEYVRTLKVSDVPSVPHASSGSHLIPPFPTYVRLDDLTPSPSKDSDPPER